ncbi:MAG: exodeoxyribonuclease VII large subunit [Candidatus Doudnabacteria bacterium]|nr:exodeoxyribonuclease VII large subunit [Candidatus Doudnabacteria bacterium]
MYELQRKLKDLRRALAEAEGLELFMVFGNATIDELCTKLPKNAEELLEVKGMGEKKVQKYGKAILAIVNSQEISNDQFLISNESIGVDVAQPSLVRSETSPPEGEKDRQFRTEGKQKVTVSQYIEYLNLVLQRTADVRVVGEVSSGKMYPSGYYFTLKDMEDETALSCYIPTYTYRGLGLPLDDGMQVSVEGVPRMVKRNGRFQFTVENVQLVGEGALKKSYDLLKAKLEAEGLFERKRDLPEFVTSVGVITSRAGAVIHDFRNNLAKLGITVYLKDVRVEGASSAQMVMDAVRWFNEKSLTPPNLPLKRGGTSTSGLESADVIVIMRGGGSLEDMQAFNTEAVVRTIFGSKIPTIVSIGHDKDVPLAQLAADVMVSTPTAAAHAVSGTWSRLAEGLPGFQNNLVYYAENYIQQVQSRFTLNVQSVLNWCSRLAQGYRVTRSILVGQVNRYVEWVQQQRMGLTSNVGRIGQMQVAALERVRATVDSAESFLEQANPERQLKMGYSIVKTRSGKVVRSVADAQAGEQLRTQVSDGEITSVVE